VQEGEALDQPVDLSVIIVNWNARDRLAECLTSIEQQAGRLSLETWVVDNGSTDGSAELVEGRFPWVKLLVNQENRGFARANNQALRRAQGRYLLLLNPDTVILDDALMAMIDFLDVHPDVGAVGCRLVNPDGSMQTSSYSFPTLFTILVSAYGLKRLLPLNLLRRSFLGRALEGHFGHLSRHDQVRSVDFVTGACMMVRREVMEQVGLLDENFFLYAEEIDWCRRIKEAGWEVYFTPQAQVIHHIGQSSRQSGEALALLYRSRCYYFRKHHGQLGLFLLRLIVLPALLLQATWNGVRAAFCKLMGQAREGPKEACIRYWKAVQACISPLPSSPWGSGVKGPRSPELTSYS